MITYNVNLVIDNIWCTCKFSYCYDTYEAPVTFVIALIMCSVPVNLVIDNILCMITYNVLANLVITVITCTLPVYFVTPLIHNMPIKFCFGCSNGLISLLGIFFQVTSTNITNSIANHSVSPLPEPIGKGRSSSTSSSITSNDSGSFYQRAPGSEREDVQVGYIVSKFYFSLLLFLS